MEPLRKQDPLRARLRRVIAKNNFTLPDVAAQINIALPTVIRFIVHGGDVKPLVFFKIEYYVTEMEQKD